MKLRNFRTFLAIFTTLSFVTFFTLWNYSEQKPPAYAFGVRLPLLPKQSESQEELYYRNRKALFPQMEIPNPIPSGLLNAHTFLVVSLEKDKKININREEIAEITKTEPLTNKLREVFEYRQEKGVFEENSEKVLKAVVIKAPLSTRYGELLEIVDAVKESGADPIVLQIDELPQ